MVASRPILYLALRVSWYCLGVTLSWRCMIKVLRKVNFGQISDSIQPLELSSGPVIRIVRLRIAKSASVQLEEDLQPSATQPMDAPGPRIGPAVSSALITSSFTSP